MQPTQTVVYQQPRPFRQNPQCPPLPPHYDKRPQRRQQRQQQQQQHPRLPPVQHWDAQDDMQPSQAMVQQQAAHSSVPPYNIMHHHAPYLPPHPRQSQPLAQQQPQQPLSMPQHPVSQPPPLHRPMPPPIPPRPSGVVGPPLAVDTVRHPAPTDTKPSAPTAAPAEVTSVAVPTSVKKQPYTGVPRPHARRGFVYAGEHAAPEDEDEYVDPILSDYGVPPLGALDVHGDPVPRTLANWTRDSN
jgi:hypothetical protein